MIDNGSFYAVCGWMINELGLTKTEAPVYAIIYGYTQPNGNRTDTWYMGSRGHIAEWIGVSKDTVSRTLASLVERGLLEKRTRDVNGITLVDYRTCHRWVRNEGRLVADYIDPSQNAAGVSATCIGGMSNLHRGICKMPTQIDNDIDKDIHKDNNPPYPMYSLRNDKETSYGTEEGNISKLLTGEYIGIPPTGESVAAAADSKKNKTSDIPFEEIRDLYNTICASLPKCRTVTDKRKAAIRARWKEGFRLSDFEEVFKIAQASDFLKGQIGNRHWKADFDYLISPKMVKVLEGAYGGEVVYEQWGSAPEEESYEAWKPKDEYDF